MSTLEMFVRMMTYFGILTLVIGGIAYTYATIMDEHEESNDRR